MNGLNSENNLYNIEVSIIRWVWRCVLFVKYGFGSYCFKFIDTFVYKLYKLIDLNLIIGKMCVINSYSLTYYLYAKK